MAQDNQDQDDLPDGDKALAEESESDLTELQKKFVVKFVVIVAGGLIIVSKHFLTISIANLLQISFSTFDLVNIPPA